MEEKRKKTSLKSIIGIAAVQCTFITFGLVWGIYAIKLENYIRKLLARNRAERLGNLAFLSLMNIYLHVHSL